MGYGLAFDLDNENLLLRDPREAASNEKKRNSTEQKNEKKLKKLKRRKKFVFPVDKKEISCTVVPSRHISITEWELDWNWECLEKCDELISVRGKLK